MSATAAVRASGPPGPVDEIASLFAGVALAGPGADLARRLDHKLLDELGWDPRRAILTLPAGHRLVGRRVCGVEGCTANVCHGLPGVCLRCFTRLTGLGYSAAQIASGVELPGALAPADRCAVAGCAFLPTVRGALLCEPHVRQLRQRRPAVSVAEFLADPRVRPHPPAPACLVAACTRIADGACGLCNTHYQRWRVATRADPGLDLSSWAGAEPGVAEPGQVSLRGLAPLVVIEVLFGVCQRVGRGAKLPAANLRAVCDHLRRHRAASISDCDAEAAPTKAARSLLRAFARDTRRALSDPGGETHNDTWDLAIFGHHGNLCFAGISQEWLGAAARAWAAEDLPRHRGKGAARVQSKIGSLGLLSEHLRLRPDHGQLPGALGRADIEGFSNRLAYLESTGRISRYRRNLISRDVRAVLAGLRALGLTRPGGPATGLAGDFAIERCDIASDPERSSAGRDIPTEVMAILCANLHTLGPTEVAAATQVLIDTGRRPEEVIGLGWDCLTRDSDGGAVLVYDNAKADRWGRRLPISDATAAVITAQQQGVRARFPATPLSELKLLPAPRANPDGCRPISISMLEGRHRHWVEGLPELAGADGVAFDKAKVVPYAYRHSYAQRHADAGVGIDVLADLLDHRSYSVTRGYYRIGEDRRRAAVDRVATISFDRRGKPIWREALSLLESEHTRYALGEVAVPFGICTEPSNVKAGGNACPFRFRCVGCDHFRTDVSYLPDLQAYLEDLLRSRERLLAATEIEDWARTDAMPSEEEVARIRRLITRVRSELAKLSPEERAQLDDAVATVRQHRAVTVGMPRVRQPLPDVRPPRPT